MSAGVRSRKGPADIAAALSSSRTTSQKQAAVTVSWNETEEWQRDNEYILSGYRRAQRHWTGCCRSIYAYLHNETVNIHTHLWGAMLFLYLLLNFPGQIERAGISEDWKDRAVFSIFFLGAIFCLSASALFHVSSCHSQSVRARCHSFDYSGIVVLTVSSFYPSLYYGFFCEPRLRAIYLFSITALGFGAAYVVLNPEYTRPSHRGTRTAVFVALGLSAMVPVAHWIILHGIHALFWKMGFNWLALSGATYICGALLYANRIPDRFYPGRFDVFFASHQVFHCCVVAAAVLHYYSVWDAVLYSKSQSCKV